MILLLHSCSCIFCYLIHQVASWNLVVWLSIHCCSLVPQKVELIQGWTLLCWPFGPYQWPWPKTGHWSHMPIVSTMNVHNRMRIILVEVVLTSTVFSLLKKTFNERSSEDHKQSLSVIMPSRYFFMAASWAIFSQLTSSSTKILYLCSCWNLHLHHQSSCWSKNAFNSSTMTAQVWQQKKWCVQTAVLPSKPEVLPIFLAESGQVHAAIQQKLYLSLGFGCSSSN